MIFFKVDKNFIILKIFELPCLPSAPNIKLHDFVKKSAFSMKFSFSLTASVNLNPSKTNERVKGLYCIIFIFGLKKKYFRREIYRLQYK